MKRIVGCLLVMVCIFNSCSLNKSVERRYKRAIAKSPYDAIIIPGYPYRAKEHKELFTIRLHWAVHLYKQGIAKNIIFSGNAVHTPYIEAKIMKMYAVQMGVPEENVFVEPKALHSNENVRYGKRLAKKLGFKSYAFATDPYQFSYLKTIVLLIAPFKPIISFPTDSMKVYNRPLPEIDVKKAFVKNWTEKTDY